MDRATPTPAVAADAAGVAEVVAALEAALYGQSTFSRADLEEEWSEVDLQRDAWVVRDGARIVGYGVVREPREPWQVEAYVHPDAHGRGLGSLLATWLEQDAARRGALRLQNACLEADAPARRLLESLGYAPVRIFREMRIVLGASPPAACWPDGLRAVAFDPELDARAFHAAHQEAFADHWEHRPRDFAAWAKAHLDEIAAGTICTGETYGGGFVHALFTRRPWRGRGVGAALLADAFGRFWAAGEHTVRLGVDAASDTGAFRLYERAGMSPTLGWALYEKELGGPPTAGD
jgi:mycothiol synthase